MKVPFRSDKEYPVVVDVSNCIKTPLWVRTTERISLEEGLGIAFKIDNSSFADLEVGDTAELLKIGNETVSDVTKLTDTSVSFRIFGWSNTAVLTAPTTWFCIIKTGATQYKLAVCSTQGVESLNDVPLNTWSLYSTQNDITLDDEPFISYSREHYTEGCFGFGSFDDVLSEFAGWDFIADSNATGYEVLDNEDKKILADNPIDSEAFTYESSILVCLDVANMKVTFGDFRNNLLKDWTAGDWNGDGYIFDSYLISHPMNSTSASQFTGRRITDLVHTKNMPYLVTYFRRTETGELTDGSYIYPSQCQGSILWDWRTSGREGKWSSPTDLYRPNKRTILDNGYIINKTNIRGLGRAYQVKLESVEGSQFILEGIVYDLKNDGRI